MPSNLRARLLLVDDDDALAEMYALQLTASGFQVTTARSGAEALQLVVDATPDLIYLDLGLPGMTGLEVLERLRRAPNTSSRSIRRRRSSQRQPANGCQARPTNLRAG
jgi:DNA-binding response OmpR family regulator